MGSEFQVNLAEEGVQSASAVDSDIDGNFVVVWQSATSVGTDSSGWSVQGREFLSDGTPVRGQSQINTYTIGGQEKPSIAWDPLGHWIAVWKSGGSPGDDNQGSSIVGRKFEPSLLSTEQLELELVDE